MDDEPDRINAAALLLARGTPAQPALVCEGRSMAYGELRRAVARAATVWVQLGVQPGEVVMLRGTGIEQVVAFLGAMWAGAVPVPLRQARAAGEQGAQPQVAVRYALDQHLHARGGDSTVPWQEWDAAAIAQAAPMLPVRCDAWAPACWTDPRSWDPVRPRILPQRFALALIAPPGKLQLARARTTLGVLRALRRGVTVVLGQAAAADALPRAAAA